MGATCIYHCRTCGGHFTSLRAFDAHRSGGECSWPDDTPLVELEGGTCRIADPTTPAVDVTLYEHESAGEARGYFRGENGRDTASGKRKRAVAA